MIQLTHLSDDQLLEIIGNRWPEMTKALKIYADPKRCQENHDKARVLLIKFIQKNNLKG